MPPSGTAGHRIEEDAPEETGDAAAAPPPLLALDVTSLASRTEDLDLQGLTLVDDLPALEEALAREPEARCLLLHDTGELGLARRIEAGLSTQAALAAWGAEARRLLAFLGRFQHRSWLLERFAFLQDPQQALRQLGVLVTAAAPLPQQEANPPLPSPGARLVALELLRRSPDAAALAEELAAGTTALAAAAPAPLDLDRAYRALAAPTPPRAEPEAPAPDPSLELAELREEHDAVLAQLLKAQEVAEKQRQRAQEAERWLAKRDAKLEWIYASRTYRATIPLRWLGMKLGGKKPGHWAGGGAAARGGAGGGSRGGPGGDKRHAG